MSNQRFSITPASAVSDESLTDSIYRTLAAIGLYGDKNGWCWPRQTTLAKIRGVSRKTINIHIKELTGLGYLNIQPRYDEETGAQKSNMMQVKFDNNYQNVTGGVTPRRLQGGVTPRRLQGGGSPGGYRGGEVQEVTHNALKNDPIEELITYFLDETKCRPPNGNMKEKWLDPLVAIYQASSDDFDETKRRIKDAAELLREKGFTIANPGSIQNTAVAMTSRKLEISYR